MSNYNAKDLKVLKGLEAVRKRPGMYIGSTDSTGLHHLIWEIVDNALDEALAGYANEIKVTLKADGSCIVEDNGRGIPVDKHSGGKTGVELIFTELHAGGKFEEGVYKTSGGLHGVGSSVVNALSSKLIAKVYRDKEEYETEFEQEKIVTRTHKIGSTTKRGTRIQFWPDFTIFKKSKFSSEIVKEKLRESSFLIPNLKIYFTSELNNDKVIFETNEGIKEYVKYIAEGRNLIGSVFHASGVHKKIDIDIAMVYTDNYNESIFSFVNNVKTRDGGTHEVAFKSALTKTINEYASAQGIMKNKTFEGNDVREGLVAVISLKVPESILEFVGQTKDKLGTAEAREAVEEFLSENLMFYLNENKKEADVILTKIKKSIWC